MFGGSIFRYLATGLSFNALAFTFRVGATTVGKIVAETVAVLWEELQEDHMPVPTEATFKSIAKEFYNTWNFPNCLGSIDGKHIRVMCPQNSGSMFFNYKKFFSVVLQAIADAHYKFITIDVGGYGKQSDGGTFQASDMYKVLKNGKMKIPQPSCLPNTKVKAPYVFVGDEAYPLLPYLLTPYGGQHLNFEDTTFNQRLSRCRKTVECAFGILFSKWRILSKCIETKVEVVDDIVKCICVLHNIIIDKEGIDQHLTETLIVTPPQHMQRHYPGRPANMAKSVREIFKSFLVNNPLVYKD